MTQEDFEVWVIFLVLGTFLPMTDYLRSSSLVQSVKNAISDGIHPKIISKGSSGSYFARAKISGGRVQTIALVYLWFIDLHFITCQLSGCSSPKTRSPMGGSTLRWVWYDRIGIPRSYHPCISDDEMDPPTISMDYSLRSCLLDTQSKVWIHDLTWNDLPEFLQLYLRSCRIAAG